MMGLNPKLKIELLKYHVTIQQCPRLNHKFSATQDVYCYLPEVGGKHPTIHQEFASDTHQERLELCNPSNRIEQAHLYS